MYTLASIGFKLPIQQMQAPVLESVIRPVGSELKWADFEPGEPNAIECRILLGQHVKMERNV